MLVIFGVKLSKAKNIVYSLSHLYGVGVKRATEICLALGISTNAKLNDLTDEQQFQIIKYIKENYLLESNLRAVIKNDVRNYMLNGSIRGFRHSHHLPVRGQRTHANAKTPKRVIMGIALRNKQ